jgi:hypothetical protein
VLRLPNLLSGIGPFLAAALGALSFWSIPAHCQENGGRKASGTEQIVVTGPKSLTDQEVTKRVETALDSNPYLDASRVTVTTRDGVVRLEGMIGGDPLDLIAALRITYRVAGVRRVIDDLDTHDFDNGP